MGTGKKIIDLLLTTSQITNSKYLFQKTETDASTKTICPVFFHGYLFQIKAKLYPFKTTGMTAPLIAGYFGGKITRTRRKM